MGNLTSTVIIHYHRLEAVPAVVVVLGGAIVFYVLCLPILCGISCWSREKKSVCELHYIWWEFWVTTVFRHAVTKRVLTTRGCERGDYRQLVTPDRYDDQTGLSEDVLFAEIKPNDEAKSCGCTPSCRAIAYFVIMLFWALWSAWVVFWDNLFYSKITRCIDINTKDDTITCFYINNYSQADCEKIAENGQAADVICYALNRGKLFTAVGIAFSVCQIVIFGSQIYFVAVLRLYQWIEKKCTNGCCNCCGTCCGARCGCCFSVWLAVAFFFALLAFVLWPALSVTLGGSSGFNFFYANEPLRWIQLGLLVLTSFTAVWVPWCIFVSSDGHYVDRAAEIPV